MPKQRNTTGIYSRWADRDNEDRFHGPQGGHYYGVSYTNVNEPYKANRVAAVEGLNRNQNRYGFDRGFYNADAGHPQNDPYKDAFFEPVYLRRQRAQQQFELPRFPHENRGQERNNMNENRRRREFPQQEFRNEREFRQSYIGSGEPQHMRNERNYNPDRDYRRAERLPYPARNNDGYYRDGQHYNAARMPPQFNEPWPQQNGLNKLNGPYRGTPHFNPDRPPHGQFPPRPRFRGDYPRWNYEQ